LFNRLSNVLQRKEDEEFVHNLVFSKDLLGEEWRQLYLNPLNIVWVETGMNP